METRGVPIMKCPECSTLKSWVEKDSTRFNNQKVNFSGLDDLSFKRGYEFMSHFILPMDTVLDAGAKWDRGSKIIKCAKYYCTDKDKSRVEYAAKKNELNNVIYLHKDVLREKLQEIESGQVDAVVTTSLFHHYPKEVIPEIMSVLSGLSKKYIMIFAPNGQYYDLTKFDPKGQGDHEYHPNIWDLENAGEFYGFVPHAIYYDHYPGYKQHFCVILKSKDLIKKETNECCLKDR